MIGYVKFILSDGHEDFAEYGETKAEIRRKIRIRLKNPSKEIEYTITFTKEDK
jgi:hypothetical protein